MTFWLTVLGYAVCGAIVSRMVRNMILNNYYRKNLAGRQKAIDKLHANPVRGQSKSTMNLIESLEECKHEEALKQAHCDAHVDIVAGSIFSLIFWPFVVVILITRQMFQIFSKINYSFLPASQAEREVKKIIKQRTMTENDFYNLQMSHAALMQLAKEANLDTKGLELIERNSRPSPKSQ
jgi:hypothetical protein